MDLVSKVINSYAAVVYTYKTIGIEKLASHYLGYNEIKELSKHFKGEMTLLQTCNRIELYLYSEDDNLSKVLDYLNQVHNREISSDATILRGKEAITHLFEVASGIDSLSVGEYEILKQIKDSMKEATKLGLASKHMRCLLERSLKVGRKVRLETGISKGKVGVYSLAVEYAKRLLGDISDKKIAILGAGEIGTKLALILHNEGVKDVTIFNRTNERGRNVAIKYGYSFLPLDFSKLSNYDLVFSAIFYPEKVRAPERSVVIDLGSPSIFEGKNVYTLRDLEAVSQAKLEERRKEIDSAKGIIENGLREFEKDCLDIIYDNFVSSFMSKVEQIRESEVTRALRVLETEDPKTKEVLDAMTRSMIKKIFSPMFENLRRAVESNEVNHINLAVSLFSYGGISEDKAKEVKAEQEHKGFSGRNEVNGR
ncbi:glutamyl-tRNA reductase [Metallosphaera cuprina]|uniref:Glutamyl-tRNA reductase n=1 Tax=Metallosphaera cuprina (strain Ar-4) TaxID=1006006 RepID=F4G173_METCR|nr:glutamyl-tRNA reductase [Metallosphaera cuprina]AEB95960.1 glutamyl-tRNA reductase [Metallosphaera cuprina Ar-4]